VPELFVPRTDAGVLAQVVLTMIVGTPLVVALHRRRLTELVWFVGGLMLLLLGLFAFRTVH
jgi:hypothetical protein